MLAQKAFQLAILLQESFELARKLTRCWVKELTQSDGEVECNFAAAFSEQTLQVMYDLPTCIANNNGVQFATRLPQSENAQSQSTQRMPLSTRASRTFFQFANDLGIRYGQLEG